MSARHSPSRGTVASARPVPSSRFQRIADRQREQAADGIGAQRVDQQRDVGAAQAGPRGVMHQHPVGFLRYAGQRLERVGHRLLATLAARTTADARIDSSRAAWPSGRRPAQAPRRRRRCAVPPAMQPASTTASGGSAGACIAWGPRRRIARRVPPPGRSPSAGPPRSRHRSLGCPFCRWGGVERRRDHRAGCTGGTTWKKVSFALTMPRSVRARSSIACAPSLRSRTSAASVRLRVSRRVFSSVCAVDGGLEAPDFAHAVRGHPDAVLQQHQRTARSPAMMRIVMGVKD